MNSKTIKAWRNVLFALFLIGAALISALASAVFSAMGANELSMATAILALLLALLIAVTVVPRLAHRAKLELLFLPIQIQITNSGWFFLAVTTIVGFAAVNAGNNLLYLIFSILIAVIFASSIISRLSLRDISIKLRIPDHIFVGEPTIVSVTAVNHKRFIPSFSLLVEAESTRRTRRAAESGRARRWFRWLSEKNEQLNKIAYFTLLPGNSQVRQYSRQVFDKRGKYHISGFRISTRFPTGFFKRSRHVDASGELVVYPRPRPVDDFFHLLPMLAGRFESRFRGGTSADLYGIRQYIPSDHMRNINWKATAKSSQLMVREFTREDEWKVNLVFDTSLPQSPTEDFDAKFERAITFVASLASHFIREGSEVRLITPSDILPYAAGQGQLYRILGTLAVLEPEDFSSRAKRQNSTVSWWLYDELPALHDDRHFKIIVTSAPKGSIPASLWRSAHVIYLEDL